MTEGTRPHDCNIIQVPTNRWLAFCNDCKYGFQVRETNVEARLDELQHRFESSHGWSFPK